MQQFALATPQSLSYQGRILDSSNSPLENSSVIFRFTLLSPDGTCELWTEDKAPLNMTNSGGIFDLTIGPSAGLATALENGTNHTCINSGNYTGIATAGRLLKVEFNPSNTGWRVITPNLSINSVPYASVAAKLGNMTAGDFIARPGTCSTGQSVYFDGTNFVCQSLAAGDIPNIDAAKITTGTLTTNVSSATGQFTNLRIYDGVSQYITMNYPSAGAASYTINWPATQGAASTVLQNDGAGNLSWAAAGSGSGDITEVVAGAGLTGGATTGIATLAVDSGLGANKVPMVGGAPLGANGVVVANGLGTALTSLNCTIGQVIKFNVSGFATCGADSDSGSGAFLNSGNSFGATANLGTNDNFSLNLETDNTPRVTILNDGKVGIGTTAPFGKLDVVDESIFGLLGVFRGFSDMATPTLNISRTRGTVAAPAEVQNGDFLGAISFGARTGLSTVSRDAIAVAVDGTYTSGQSVPTRLMFMTDAGNGAPERMRITSTGNVGIGTTNPQALLQLGTPTSSLGTLRLAGNTSGYVQLQPAAAAGSWNMTLPAGPGTNGQVLSTNGSGVTSWTTIAGGSGDITQGGNSFTAPMTIGTNDAQPLNLETNNSSRMTILANGNVGIGMTNPYSALTVRGNIEADTTGTSAVWAGSGGDYIRMTEGSTAGLTAFKNLMISSGNGAATGSAFTIGFKTGGYDNDPTMTITGGNPGNVGIGTASPTSKLSILETNTSTTAGTKIMQDLNLTNSGAVSTGTDTTIGSRISVDRSNQSAGTNNTYGQFINVNGLQGAGATDNYFGQVINMFPSQSTSSLENSYGSRVNYSVVADVGNHYGYYSSVRQGSTGSTVYGFYSDTSRVGASSPQNYSYYGKFGSGGSGGFGYGLYLDGTDGNAGSVTGLYVDVTNGSRPTSYSGIFLGGNFGIGVAAPTSVLDLGGAITQRGTAAPGLSASGQGRIYFSTAENKFKVSQNGAAYTDLVSAGGGSSSGTAGHLQFSNGSSGFNSDTNQLFWDATNNRLGIGNSTPENMLHISGRAKFGTLTGYDSGADIMVNNMGGSYLHIGSDANDFLLGSNSTDSALRVTFGDLQFRTGGAWNANAIADGTTRMIIKSTGNIGIGVTSPQAALDVVSTGTSSAVIVPRATTANRPTTLVDGMIRYNTTTTLFEFYQNGTWVNYTTVSDGRLKTNVTPIDQGLHIVNQLNPVFYDWDSNNPKTSGFEDRHQIGFIAQEVEKVLPEVVNKGGDGYRSLEYGKIVSVVVAAVKELYAKVIGHDEKIQAQKREIASVKADNAAKDKKIKELEERLEKIEKVINSR